MKMSRFGAGWNIAADFFIESHQAGALQSARIDLNDSIPLNYERGLLGGLKSLIAQRIRTGMGQGSMRQGEAAGAGFMTSSTIVAFDRSGNQLWTYDVGGE